MNTPDQPGEPLAPAASDPGSPPPGPPAPQAAPPQGEGDETLTTTLIEALPGNAPVDDAHAAQHAAASVDPPPPLPVAAEAAEPARREPPEPETDNAAVLAQSRSRTRRSFLSGAAAAAAGFGFYQYLQQGPQVEHQPALLRRAFEWNATLARRLAPTHILAPTYPLSRAETLRLNGFYGLKRALLPASWRLQLVGAANAMHHPRYTPDVTAWEYQYTEAHAPSDQAQLARVNPDVLPSLPAPNLPSDDQMEDDNHTGRRPRGFEEAGESNSTLPARTPGLLLTLEDVLKLPRHELVTQFKCIEGWSQIVHWAGVRFADFLEAYPPAPVDGRTPRYVYTETPDGDYYTGYDLSVLRHPQALLVTEMMGAPLTPLHGAPLRLHLPTKYGYKQIKRIGLIAYTNEKPDDYWTKLGYDWFAGL